MHNILYLLTISARQSKLIQKWSLLDFKLYVDVLRNKSYLRFSERR